LIKRKVCQRNKAKINIDKKSQKMMSYHNFELVW